MEHRNSETVTFQNLFWDSRTGLFPWANGLNNQQPNTFTAGNVTQFHLYTIEWDATQIRWFIDRTTNPNPVHTVNISAATMEEFRKPFHIILNLAIAGQFPGTQPNQAASCLAEERVRAESSGPWRERIHACGQTSSKHPSGGGS